MERKMRKLGHALIFLAVVAAAIVVIMLLWNALIPSIMGWSAINFWQAAGLLILCKLLFGGFGHHWKHHHWKHHHCKHHKFGHPRFGHDHKEEFKHFHEAMKGMTRDERRDYIRERMKRGFGESPETLHNKED